MYDETRSKETSTKKANKTFLQTALNDTSKKKIILLQTERRGREIFTLNANSPDNEGTEETFVSF